MAIPAAAATEPSILFQGGEGWRERGGEYGVRRMVMGLPGRERWVEVVERSRGLVAV